ncbi:hypothetical protein TcasGA2_TC031114 [Tribolium castaneum]|uniref:Uncharacterized protein n=1 Tax=Tribolium castaneum TaxID=7070 RepID=A0A139WJQ0_TRICA|nr:hypothetical protein TcasGA2_TC031114 [Tribolium castaneum]
MHSYLNFHPSSLAPLAPTSTVVVNKNRDLVCSCTFVLNLHHRLLGRVSDRKKGVINAIVVWGYQLKGKDGLNYLGLEQDLEWRPFLFLMCR